jgi:hypothetical protein
MRPGLRLLPGLLCGLAVGALAVGLDGAPIPVGALGIAGAMTATAQAGAAAVLWTGLCVGCGSAALRQLAPALTEGAMAWLHALVTGLLIWGLLGLLVAAFGGLAPLGMLGVGGLMLAASALGRRPALPAVHPGWWLVLGLLLLPGMVHGLAPPLETDELYTHLALPGAMLREGGLLGGVLHPQGSRPLALHLPYAFLLATGGEAAPRLFHLLIAGAVLLATGQLGERVGGPRAAILAPLLLAGSYSFLAESGLAGNDLPTALAVLAALDAGLRGSPGGLAVAAGAALSLKYTAAGPLAGIYLVAAMPWSRRVGAGFAALLFVSPWWLRNAVEGLHPLFPFLGWSAPDGLRFQYLEKYGAGRSAIDFLLLPWNATMSARIESFRFLGRVSPALLFLVPWGLVAAVSSARRGEWLPTRIWIVALLGCVSWAIGPHWLRYLLPCLPVLALALAVGARFPSALLGAGAALLVGLPQNWAPLGMRVGDRIEVAFGLEGREAFLERKLDSWQTIRWANAHLPPDAKVALFFEWSEYLLERPAVLGSVEDHVPSRAWLLGHGDDSLRDLRALGVTHVIRTRTRFLDKLYPFVTPAELQRSFNGPVEQLDRLLLEQATLEYQGGRTAIWRLGPLTAEGRDAAP